MLINGVWQKDWQPVQSKDEDGRFVRQQSVFRNWITPDGSAGPTGKAGFQAQEGRYRLYVALICPWASRTLIARQLKGLEEMIAVTVLNPRLTDQGWAFGGFYGADEDPMFRSSFMHELYTRADSTYTGRATVPVLWDMQANTIVNNESADILRMLNTAFDNVGAIGPDLYPAFLADKIDALNTEIYETLNNGVYKAGFASSQQAYEEANAEIFAQLDQLDARLSDGRRFVFGDAITETDVRLFVTLIRFDAAYHGLFKTNHKRIADYPHLQAFLKSLLALKGGREAVDIDHIKAGYYSVKALNPLGIVPNGPDLSALGL
ncbi:glutathione S-transferase family protein [Maritalea sp.]|uniref:glutathione S-transferase family protein n=1 Tax=Maritalea sp. TaxID=2003361 RepID=UPI003EF66A3B